MSSSRSNLSKGCPARPKGKSSTRAEKKEFELPALSVPYRPPKITESELQKLRKKTIRRNAPPGEDLKHIKEILRTIKNQNTTVQEFISLIAPSTGDKGETLRTVMQDDLNAFRKLARKVYDTITQDNSDVLHNQQIQLAEYYKERKTLLQERMMKKIEEIYSMAQDFNFDRYAVEGEKYLKELFPIPAELTLEPEEMEMMKRQAAYHRLQWLRSEGERLNEENNSLKNRLEQLRRTHNEEQMAMMQREKQAEYKKNVLEAEQAEKFQELEELNESLEKTIIDKEKTIREDIDKCIREPMSTFAESKKQKAAKKRIKKQTWNEIAAKQIENKFIEQTHAANVASLTAQAARQTSPFHYSPPAAAPRTPCVPCRPAPPPKPQCPAESCGRRRGQPPPDTWGGFY